MFFLLVLLQITIVTWSDLDKAMALSSIFFNLLTVINAS